MLRNALHQRSTAAIAFCGVLAGVVLPLLGQQPDAGADAGAWQFERLLLADGTELVGFFQDINEREVEFVEVTRPPGRPMRATVRVVSPNAVARLERLPPDLRSKMLDKFRAFRQRAAIEAGSMLDVALSAKFIGGLRWWHYEGDWFTLESTADEQSTRRCIVRIEQIFRAYRQLLPPRSRPQSTLSIRLHGSLDEYYGALRELGLRIENLAFYAPRSDLIVAGAELSQYANELARIQHTHQDEVVRVQRDYDRFREGLRQRSQFLSEQGSSRGEVKDEMRLRTAAWHKEHASLLRRINETNRRNAAKFEEVTARMFRRLYHEAFHAYLDRFVCAGDPTAVDRWLNEGLAQVFEGGQLDGNTLRIDAPDSRLLAQLQRDLAADTPLTLAQLLASDDRDFIASHDTGSSQRHYLYAWGVAYYLTIHQGILRDSRLEWYFDAAGKSSVPRLEELTGKPLASFEAEWRQAMLALRSP